MTQAMVRSPAEGSGAMFDRIANRYDLLNRVVSLGNDERWRRATVAALQLAPGHEVLDLATGTGDVAFAIARAEHGVKVVGLDPSEEMLKRAREKAAQNGLGDRCEFVAGEAERLPFADDRFDAVSIAFGIRNCHDRPAALREMCRVTKPGGRIAVLELSEPNRGLLAPFAQFYMRHVVPLIGGWLSSGAEYRYLQRSVAAFPPPDQFSELMDEQGIRVERMVPLTFGVCVLYLGSKTSAS